jgi:metalloprotease
MKITFAPRVPSLAKTALAGVSVVLLSACSNMNVDGMVNAGVMGMQALTLSDADMKTLTDGACAEMDTKNKVAGAKDKYTVRLNKLIKGMPTEVNGMSLNYKVYSTKEVNAWAMANGCVRVYTGLMDMMNDDEVRGVLGHEIGHVALGHSRKAMQTAYGVAAAREAAGSVGNGTVAALSSSQLGDIGEAFINAQFSQSQEMASDNYSFDLLAQKGFKREGLKTGFEKLAKLDGGSNSVFSSHPSSKERAENIANRLAGK